VWLTQNVSLYCREVAGSIFATAAVAVQVTLGPSGTCERAGIGLTNVGPTPIQARRAEAFLTGKRLDDAAIRPAGQLAAEEAQPTRPPHTMCSSTDSTPQPSRG